MKKDIETHQLQELLKRVSNLGYEEPSLIVPSEKPDFILTIGGALVGVETTAAVYQEYVRANKIHHKILPRHCIETTHLKDGALRRSNDELIDEMLNLNSDWQDAEEGMREWRDKVARSLERKRTKLNGSDFQAFSQNWLLIYDEPGLANDVFTHDRACRYAASLFSAPYLSGRDFDSVFLLSDRYLFRWHEQKLNLNYRSEGEGVGSRISL